MLLLVEMVSVVCAAAGWSCTTSSLVRPAAVSYSNWKPLPEASSRCRLMMQPLLNTLIRCTPTLPLPEKASANTPIG